MIINQLHKESSPKLILFFNGWGMDSGVLSHFDHRGYDVVMVSCYHQEISQKETVNIDDYDKVYLVAWSMGVYFALDFMHANANKIHYSVAINGTYSPIDDDKGILKAIFEGTIQNMNAQNLKKFNRRMFVTKTDFERFEKCHTTRLLDEQIEELKYIKDRCVPKVFTHTFDKVFVAQNDRIILSENQNKAWENHPFVIKNDCPHFPFYQLNNWSEILKDE